MSRMPNLIIEDATLIFRNFSGEQQRYNPAGKRNVCVRIPEESEQQLIEDGWHLKYLKPRDEDERPTAYLKVNVSYYKYPPEVYMIVHGRKVEVDEANIGKLDHLDIIKADIEISPYFYDNDDGKKGISAYLSSLYVTVNNSLAAKYADM